MLLDFIVRQESFKIQIWIEIKLICKFIKGFENS
jgi:hypothetical protein